MARNTFRRVSADARVKESIAPWTPDTWSPDPLPHNPICSTQGPGAPTPPTEDTVPKERQHDEVDGEHHATLHAALRFDAVVHDLVPVLTSQNLKGRKKHTANPPLSHGPLGDAAVGPEPVCPCSEGLSAQLLGKETLGATNLFVVSSLIWQGDLLATGLRP